MKCVSFCLLISLVSDKIWAQGLIVKLGTRRVNGTTRTAADGKIFNAFYGIPYAIPPVGRLRFKAPIEAPPWLGTLDATKIPNICVQIPEGSVTTDGNEDCLTLNIYTPKNAKKGDNIPVIFYIFGGGFEFGSSLVYGPEHFMKRDIIIVMPNYRLGVLGFLSTGDDVISGNMGLKDQSMALKWVKRNIHFFGGDCNRITIQGHSSGAICAHLHTLSPMSQGLYNRAIFQSGSGFCTVSFFDKDVMRSIAKEVAQRLGCNSSTSYEMFNCFLHLRADVFPIVQKDLNVWNSYPGAVFRPTIEDINAETPFFITPPITTGYESTDQEWMIGMTTGEGASNEGEFMSDNGRMAKILNDHHKIIMPITLQYFWHSKSKYLDYISDTLRWYYFGNQEIGIKTSTAISQLYGAGYFGYCTNNALRQYPGKKYVYLFDYISGYTLHQNLDNYDRFYGVFHADELPLLFYVPERSIYLNKYDRIFGDEMVKRWTNFAYSGDPNEPFTIDSTMFGPWKPSISSEVDFLRLKLNGSMETDLYTIDYRLWKRLPIFSKYDW